MMAEGKCNVPDCTVTEVIAFGLCRKHYKRAKYGIEGDPRTVEARKYMKERTRRAKPAPRAPAPLKQGGPARPGSPRRVARQASRPGLLAELGDLANQIATEASGLVADCQRAMEGLEATAAEARAKNKALLRSLVESRRQVQDLGGLGAS